MASVLPPSLSKIYVQMRETKDITEDRMKMWASGPPPSENLSDEQIVSILNKNRESAPYAISDFALLDSIPLPPLCHEKMERD